MDVPVCRLDATETSRYPLTAPIRYFASGADCNRFGCGIVHPERDIHHNTHRARICNLTTLVEIAPTGRVCSLASTDAHGMAGSLRLSWRRRARQRANREHCPGSAHPVLHDEELERHLRLECRAPHDGISSTFKRQRTEELLHCQAAWRPGAPLRGTGAEPATP